MNKYGLAAVVVFSCISYTDSIQRPFKINFNFGKKRKVCWSETRAVDWCGTIGVLVFARHFWKDECGPTVDIPARLW
jgi:hypothetical protein